MNLAERTSEVEAKEAALRGQLHDLSRYHEQISEREQELASNSPTSSRPRTNCLAWNRH